MGLTWWVVVIFLLGGAMGTLLTALITLSGRLAEQEANAYSKMLVARRRARAE